MCPGWLPHKQPHLPQLEEHPRVVPARDLVQEVIYQLLAVAPSIFDEFLQTKQTSQFLESCVSPHSCPRATAKL